MYKLIKYPFEEEHSKKLFEMKLQDRTCLVLLRIDVSDLELKEVVKLIIINGFDGVIFYNIDKIEHLYYIQRFIKFLDKLPKPYENVNWTVMIQTDFYENEYIKEMMPTISGCIINNVFYGDDNREDLNNVVYHSSVLNDIISESIIDTYLKSN